MKNMTGYYIPRTLSDARAFTAQFERKTLSNPLDVGDSIHFPASPGDFAYYKWQEILNSPRPYPCILEIVTKEKQVVAKCLIRDRDHLDTCFGWYWENSTHMTLGYRFTP